MCMHVCCVVTGGLMGVPLEPEEQRRMEIRRQEQAARSARIFYNLQQQVCPYILHAFFQTLKLLKVKGWGKRF